MTTHFNMFQFFLIHHTIHTHSLSWVIVWYDTYIRFHKCNYIVYNVIKYVLPIPLALHHTCKMYKQYATLLLNTSLMPFPISITVTFISIFNSGWWGFSFTVSRPVTISKIAISSKTVTGWYSNLVNPQLRLPLA